MKEVIFFKTIVPIEIGGATDDRWSRKAPDNWMSKTTVREDEEGNLWLVWSGGGKGSSGEHKIPKANLAQVSYAMVEEKPDAKAAAGGKR